MSNKMGDGHLNGAITLRLDSKRLNTLERLKKGRNRTALICRIIDIVDGMNPDDIWPEDREVRRAMAKMAQKRNES